MELIGQARQLVGVDYCLSLIKVLTPYGMDIKRAMKPYGPGQKEQLLADLATLTQFVKVLQDDGHAFNRLRLHLGHIKDLSETIQNISDLTPLTQVELYEMKCLFITMHRIMDEEASFLVGVPQKMQLLPLGEAYTLLDPSGDGLETFYIGDGYDEALAACRTKMHTVEQAIRKEKKNVAKSVLADYPMLKIRPNGTFSLDRQNDSLFQALSKDKRLFQTEEHYQKVTFGLRLGREAHALEKELDHLKLLEEEALYHVRVTLTHALAEHIHTIKHNLAAIAWLDFYLAKAFLAIGVNGTCPVFVDSGGGIEIVEGRHIAVEARLKRDKRVYTPISVRFGRPVSLITGANMGGKTIALKMLGLICAMAHYALYVPCVHLKTPLLNFLVVAIGDEQSIDKGLSTFGSEVMSLIEALNHADKEGLILIDELARGTNPLEGFALSESIIDYLKDKPSYAIVTTHLDGLGQDEKVAHYQVKGLKSFDFEKISGDPRSVIETLADQMDYRLEEVAYASQLPKDALNIAKLLGLNPAIIADAKVRMKSDKEDVEEHSAK